MNVTALIRKARSTFLGHVVFLEIFWGVPMAAFFMWRNYADGALTLGWALWCMLVSAVGALVVAALFWIFMGRPLLRRQALAGATTASKERVNDQSQYTGSSGQ